MYACMHAYIHTYTRIDVIIIAHKSQYSVFSEYISSIDTNLHFCMLEMHINTLR